MPRRWSIFLLVSTLAASANGASLPELSGTWKPFGTDDRLMTIKQQGSKITIEAVDLSCTLTDVQPSAADPHSVVASSKCFEESDALHAKETLTIIRTGRDLLLIEATVPIRRINENEDPKVDETYTNKPAVVTVYRKVKSSTQSSTRVVNEAIVLKLCPNPNAKCMARDNPDFYKDSDPAFYNQITKPAGSR
ncbi:hypothetical protein Q2941_37150 [Bradyrhizobium sp. UFLA05-153]